MGGTHYFVLSQGSGRIFVRKKKSVHIYIITTFNRILDTNTPAQYKLNSI